MKDFWETPPGRGIDVIYRSNQKMILSKKWFLKKSMKKWMNYAWFIPNYASYKHHLHWLGAYYLNKASCEVSASSLKDFLSKGRKSAKNALIMHDYAN